MHSKDKANGHIMGMIPMVCNNAQMAIFTSVKNVQKVKISM